MGDATEGWGFPGNSRKAHYFVQGRSLCMKWLFLGQLEKVAPEDVAKRVPDDCAACHKALVRRFFGTSLEASEKAGEPQ